MEKIEFSRSSRLKKPKRKPIERLYDKKPLIELVVAILSIPSLVLIVLLNYNTLRNSNKSPEPTVNPASNSAVPTSNTVMPNFFTAPLTRTPHPTEVQNASQAPCNKSLGPVTITYPSEGSTVNTNPAEVDISYDNSTYCGAVWSYSVNGSNWSDYNNSSVALYNLSNGPVTFQLRVKSITSTDTTAVTRHFTYTGGATAAVPTTASSSAQ
jgi:hypothetical protein